MPHHVNELKLLQKSRTLAITFTDGGEYTLSCEYLRVYSPSAEVRGHGGTGTLQTGKKNVNIVGIDSVGQYGVKLTFDDGHDTGIYTWDTLHDLAVNYEQYWQHYLQRLEQAGASRD
jgi:DUF971 family protein